MELGDRVYAAERITKKREKRVSIARPRPDGATSRNPSARRYRPSISLPLPRASYLSFFPFLLSFADSRLRAAAASSTMLTVRDIGCYAPTGTGTSPVS